MSGKSFLLPIAFIASTLLFSLPALGQRPVLRTPPNQFGPPPAYDLLRRPTGILPNYYQYYLPNKRLQQNLRMQENQLQRQASQVRAMQTQWQSGGQSGASMAPTGRGSSFMNYSHFYPGLSRGGR